MEGERPQLLDLFDFFWFRRHVLVDSALPAIPPPAHDTDLAAAFAVAQAGSRGALPVPRHKSALRRSLSEEAASSLTSSSDSALLVPRPLKLETILSGKGGFEEEAEQREMAAQGVAGAEKSEAAGDEIGRGHRERRRKHRERRRAPRGASQEGHSRSLSDLEFEELKGLMDLGFTFPEAAESDQRLLSIVPGLRRRAPSDEGVQAKEADKEGEGGGVEEPTVSRPYLSEAWDVAADNEERRRSHAHDHLLRNWRVPAAGEGVDMKDHLRSWAHTVASAVR